MQIMDGYSRSQPYPIPVTSTPERGMVNRHHGGYYGKYSLTPPISMSSPLYTQQSGFEGPSADMSISPRKDQFTIPIDPITLSESAQAARGYANSPWNDPILHSKPIGYQSPNANALSKSFPQQVTGNPSFVSVKSEHDSYGGPGTFPSCALAGFSPIQHPIRHQTFKVQPVTVSLPIGYIPSFCHSSNNNYGSPTSADPWIHNQVPHHVQGNFPTYSSAGGSFNSPRYSDSFVAQTTTENLTTPRTGQFGTDITYNQNIFPNFKSTPVEMDYQTTMNSANISSSNIIEEDFSALTFQMPCNSRTVENRNPGSSIPASQSDIKASIHLGELLTPDMCLPKSKFGATSAFRNYKRSPFKEKVRPSAVGTPFTDKDPACAPLNEKNPNVISVKKEPQSRSDAIKKAYAVLNHEAEDSGFESFHFSVDNISKSHDEFSCPEEPSTKCILPLELTTNAEPGGQDTDQLLPQSPSDCLPKVQRKVDQPQRSATPVDPEFRGVMLKMKTKVEEDDKVQLSIKAVFKKSSRLMRKSPDHVDKPRAHCDSSSSDSDIAAELFPKKRRSHSLGKQCASCRTKTTPLWRDAEDGTPLCNACGIRYKKYRIRCLSCWHIPRKETKTNLQCTNCGEMLKLSFFKSKQWKC